MAKRTLLLSPWYFPLRILRWQDAVKMKYEETVDVVAEYAETVSSPSTTWYIPAVIRLKSLEGSGIKKGIKFSRSNVYQRDKYRCQYCGRPFSFKNLTYDHVVPKSAGGQRNWTNIVAACRKCNRAKDDKTCDEAGMFPLNRPHRPETLPLSLPDIDPEDVPEEWLAYLEGWSI